MAFVPSHTLAQSTNYRQSEPVPPAPPRPNQPTILFIAALVPASKIPNLAKLLVP